MQAIIQRAYGPPENVLTLQEVPTPTPGKGEVLVRVHAASVHADVWHVVRGWPFVLRLMGSGLRKPANPIPGTDMSGVVIAQGEGANRFSLGDAVFGECAKSFQWANGGAYAEFVAVHEDALAGKPANVTFEQAASVPTPGLIAWHNLVGHRPLTAGQNVLINGAGGAVGAMAIQLAKALGATVTAVEHTGKIALVKALGADIAVDYTQEDPTRLTARYDLILDVASNLQLDDCVRILKPTGIYVLIGHDHYGASGSSFLGSGIPAFLKLALRTAFTPHLIKPNMSPPDKKAGMALFAEMLQAGQLTPVVDKTFPLSEIAAALQHLQSGQALGRIILTP